MNKTFLVQVVKAGKLLVEGIYETQAEQETAEEMAVMLVERLEMEDAHVRILTIPGSLEAIPRDVNGLLILNQETGA